MSLSHELIDNLKMSSPLKLKKGTAGSKQKSPSKI
jgi:hypothetical protein